MEQQATISIPGRHGPRCQRRDRSADGAFVTGVLTTGIYCRPSCAARHPKRENVRFFPNGAEAAKAGLRPCLRCLPDDVSREKAALDKAFKLIERAESAPALGELADAVGYSPHHFHRLFKRATGVTPMAFARAKRAEGLGPSLHRNGRVTDAIYDAGYSGPARFYADAKTRLGMTPSAWRDGGRGETIRWATADTQLGEMLVAATDKGICRLSFDEDESVLRERFPNATIEPGGAAMADLVAARGGRGRAARAAARSAARCPRHRVPGGGVARADPHPAGREPAATARSPPRPASPARRARRGRRAARTMSRC